MSSSGRQPGRVVGRGFWWSLGILIAILCVAAVFLAWTLSRSDGEATPLLSAAPAEDIQEVAGTRSALLYHLKSDGRGLLVEGMQLPSRDRFEEDVQTVLGALFSAEPPVGAVKVFPDGCRLNNVFFNEEQGHVVIDISAEIVTGHPGGVAAEQATMTVLMRTIAANFPRIRKCSLLVDGAQVETLAGHVRTDRPFVPSRWH
jgi:hypothetical protein